MARFLGQRWRWDRWADLERAATTARLYLDHHELESGLMRLDGAYGFAYGPDVLDRAGIGYVIRCVDYRLLKTDPILRLLKEQTPVVFKQPGTGTVRHVFDAGTIQWTAGGNADVSVKIRLIVTRRAHKAGTRSKVGKVIGQWAFEMFVVSVGQGELCGVDVVGLYFGRGGFEETLCQEDQECDPGRWLSNDPHGQSMWQLLCQHVWNVRLRLGAVCKPGPMRHTLWASPISQQGLVSPDGVAVPVHKEAAARKAHKDVETILCVAGLKLPSSAPVLSEGQRWYSAPGKVCCKCPLMDECSKTQYEAADGMKAML